MRATEGGRLNHFSAGDWADLVRGMLPSSKSAIMQAHIDQGCVECLNSSDTWGRIVEWAAEEPRNEPPDSSVRIAKAAFPRRDSPTGLKAFAQFARVIFDSFQQASPAFLRGSKSVSRQLVHEAEPFVVDLRLEAEPARGRVYLMGQILNGSHPEQMISDAEIVILAGEKTIKRGATSQSGEFHMELELNPSLYLFINVPGQRAIGIVLPDLDS